MYDLSTIWQMYLNHIENAADEDVRHVSVLIERDRYTEGLHEKELRKRVESGAYGTIAKTIWEAYRKANE